MASPDRKESSPEELDLSGLRQQLREARLDRDGWHIQARLATNHLNRILKSPAWRITKPFRIINLLAWKIKPELLNEDDDGWSINSKGNTVWQELENEIRVESDNAKLGQPKIAVLAHWSENAKVSISSNRLIDQLIANDYEVVFVSACEDAGELVFDSDQQARITILRKPNYGYDFGSWSVALAKFPEIFEASEVLILNDSNSGPYGSMNDLLGLMASSPFDITGITDSLQIRYHIQSYMMHFKNGSLSSDALRSFWLEVRSQDEKMDVIQAYELGLTSKAQSNGFYVGAIFPWNLVTDYWENPSIHGANRLLELGVPFVKREVIRSLSKKELSPIKSKIGNLYSLGVNDIEEFFTN